MAEVGRRKEGGDFISYQRADSHQRIKAWESLGSSRSPLSCQEQRGRWEAGAGIAGSASCPQAFPRRWKNSHKQSKEWPQGQAGGLGRSLLPAPMLVPLSPSSLAARRLQTLGWGMEGPSVPAGHRHPSRTAAAAGSLARCHPGVPGAGCRTFPRLCPDRSPLQGHTNT